MYSSYTAASFARKHELAERHGVNLEGALTWAFEFEDQPFFAGFRVLASNAFAAWQKMGSPAQPTPDQYAQLEKAGHLAAIGTPEVLRMKTPPPPSASNSPTKPSPSSCLNGPGSKMNGTPEEVLTRRPHSTKIRG